MNTNYIDKSILIGEIEKRLKEYQDSGDAYYIPAKRELKEILSFINTLEVKDESLGSPDYERGVKHGRDFQAKSDAKMTDKDKVISYLANIKGYPISTNGEIPSYEELFGIIKNSVIEKKPTIEMITPEESLGITPEEWNKIEDECIFGEDKPKFKIGDWIVSDYNNVAYIESISETKYNLQCKDGYHEKMSIEYIDRCWHLWTIQDAKDGDVLSDGTTIFIFKDLLSDDSVMSYCDYDTYSGESEAFCPLSMNLMCSKITPAAKEQRDILFEGMADAGYTFDFEKKELKKIEPKFKVGDWITDGYLHNKITDVLEDRYIVDTKFVKRSAILFNNESRYHLWTIQDAKNGDILSNGKSIVIFKGIGNERWNDVIDYHIGLFADSQHLVLQKNLSHWGRIDEVALHPATKEQRDLLFKKMKEAGYEWNPEKFSIEDNVQSTKIQNSSWSENDEKSFNNLFGLIEKVESLNNMKDGFGDIKQWLNEVKKRLVNKSKK